jgi:hypothetical protein
LEAFSPEAVEPNELVLDVVAQVGTQLGRMIERERAKEVGTSARSNYPAAPRAASRQAFPAARPRALRMCGRRMEGRHQKGANSYRCRLVAQSRRTTQGMQPQRAPRRRRKQWKASSS